MTLPRILMDYVHDQKASASPTEAGPGPVILCGEC